jgi:hypothetical protein
MSKEAEGTLENFGGFEASQHDFFGEKEEVVPLTPEEIIEKVSEEKVTIEKDKVIKDTAKEEKAIDDQFSEFNADFKGEESDPAKPEKIDNKDIPAAVKIGTKDTIEFLKEKGLLNFELAEGAELTEELAAEILEDTWEDSIQAGVEETIKDLPDAVKDLVRYASKGGNVTELLSQMSKHASTGLDKDSDMSVEANQIAAVTLDLQSQDYDAEDIATQIEFLKDSGKLETFSTKAFTKLLARQEKERKAGLIQIEESKVKTKATQKKYKEELTEYLGSVDNFKGIVLNKKDKETLPSYIADVKVPLQNGTTVSKFQADLFAILGDKSKLVGLAKLVNSDFDFSSISAKTITEFSKNTQAKIENADKIKLTGSSASSQKSKKSLADLLD